MAFGRGTNVGGLAAGGGDRLQQMFSGPVVGEQVPDVFTRRGIGRGMDLGGRPNANDELRSYLAGTDYWGDRGTGWGGQRGNPWTERAASRSDVSGAQALGYAAGTPEYSTYQRFMAPTNTSGDTGRGPWSMHLRNVMGRDHLKRTGQQFGGDFSMLDQLRFMEQNKMYTYKGKLFGAKFDGPAWPATYRPNAGRSRGDPSIMGKGKGGSVVQGVAPGIDPLQDLFTRFAG